MQSADGSTHRLPHLELTKLVGYCWRGFIRSQISAREYVCVGQHFSQQFTRGETVSHLLVPSVLSFVSSDVFVARRIGLEYILNPK